MNTEVVVQTEDAMKEAQQGLELMWDTLAAMETVVWDKAVVTPELESGMTMLRTFLETACDKMLTASTIQQAAVAQNLAVSCCRVARVAIQAAQSGSRKSRGGHME